MPGACQSFQLPSTCTFDAAWSCSENVISFGRTSGEMYLPERRDHAVLPTRGPQLALG